MIFNYTRDDIEFFFRKLNPIYIVIVFIVLGGIYYYASNHISSLKDTLNYKLSSYSSLRQKAQKKYDDIQRLKRYKSNVMILYSKVQTLNLLKDILTRRNFKYTLFIKNQFVSRGGMININNLATNTVKMGIYHYIPIQILVRDYVTFDNLIQTISDLQKYANFILTGVQSLSARGNNQLVLIGRLYVKQ